MLENEQVYKIRNEMLDISQELEQYYFYGVIMSNEEIEEKKARFRILQTEIRKLEGKPPKKYNK